MGANNHRTEMANQWKICTLAKRAFLVTILALSSQPAAVAEDKPFWTRAQVYEINKMSIAELRPLPPDNSNRVADDAHAAALGEKLFSDPRFSANGAVSCSGCHRPDRLFQDDLQVGHGIADVTRRTPTLIGTAYSAFLFWDGRKDSLWSQALGPLESPAEHGADRTMIVQLIAANYREEFEAVFGPFPDFGTLPAHASPLGPAESAACWAALTPKQQRAVNQTFANMGKAIEAFVRTIPVPATRFDAYAAAVVAKDMAAAETIFTEAERNGLKLFLTKGDCARCHTGPLLTDMRFYNLGLPETSAATDNGRATAVHTLKEDPFNCLGEFSDAAGDRDCVSNLLVQYGLPSQVGAFKSPTLRGVAQRAPYMHNGKFATLQDVLKHYNTPPKALFGSSELPYPRKLTEPELSDLEAFLRALDVAE